jgi:hypothetical protein
LKIQLADENRRELEEGSGISPYVVAARGYWTASRRSEVPATFSGWQRVAGLVIPTHSPAPDAGGYQLKPRKPIPRKGKKGPKYETPTNAPVTLDANPLMLEEVRRGFSELWITEGCKKVDALASRGIPCVGLTGVEMFAVKGSHGTEPLACWRYVRLRGRPVVVVYDADARTNADVQRALRRLVAMLEALGAWVRVVYLPAVSGDSKAGVDDYLAAGGSVEELRELARPFKPVDVGAERLSNDEALRAAVEGRRQYLRHMPKSRTGDLTPAAVLRVLTDEAPKSGTLTKDGGIRVVMDRRTLAERAGKSRPSVKKAVERLEDEPGALEVDKTPRRSEKAGAFVLPPVAQGVSHSGSRVAPREKVLRGGENVSLLSNGFSNPGGKPFALSEADVPAMRFPRVILYWERRDGRRVVADSHYLWRLGPKLEEIVRHIIASGVEWVRIKDLMDVFAGPSARPWDFRRRVLLPLTGWRLDRKDPDPETGKPRKRRVGPPLAEMAERDGEWMVRILPDCIESLEVYRRECLEVEDAERQRQKHADQRLTYRIKVLHRSGVPVEKIASRFGLPVEQVASVVSPADPEAELMGKEKVREIVAEMREREVQPALAFVRNTLDRIGTIRLGLLSNLWKEEGGDGFYLRLALRRLGCRARRHRDYPDEVFVYPPAEWPGSGSDVRTQKTREGESHMAAPKKAPAEVVPMRPENEPHASPENLTEPHPGAGLDPFRNTPRPDRWTVRNSDAAEAPRRPPPKVGGVYRHGPRCACWMCSDEAPAERVEVGASA